MYPSIGTPKYRKTRKLSDHPELKFFCIQRIYRQLPPAEAPELLPALRYTTKLGTKSEEVDAHTQWVRSISPIDMCAYSDGSSESHDRSFWGFALQLGGTSFNRGNGTLHGGEVYDAEIQGAAAAL